MECDKKTKKTKFSTANRGEMTFFQVFVKSLMNTFLGVFLLHNQKCHFVKWPLFFVYDVLVLTLLYTILDQNKKIIVVKFTSMLTGVGLT